MTCRALAWPLALLLWFLFCFSPFTDAQNSGREGNQDPVLLSDVKALTLHRDKMTSARRIPAIPQLTCTGGSAGCKNFVPDVVQCYNLGSDGKTAQWECKTDMKADFRFGKIEVVCEGYESPEDQTILRDSCGLEYSMELTNDKYPWYIKMILRIVAIFFFLLWLSWAEENERSLKKRDGHCSESGTRGPGRGSNTVKLSKRFGGGSRLASGFGGTRVR